MRNLTEVAGEEKGRTKSRKYNETQKEDLKHWWQLKDRSEFFIALTKCRYERQKRRQRTQDGLQEEYKAPSQYTETISFPQKVQRRHRKQIPVPETQQQLPPAKINT